MGSSTLINDDPDARDGGGAPRKAEEGRLRAALGEFLLALGRSVCPFFAPFDGPPDP